ncbi:MAG: hypothetical protein ACE5KV_01925, partial [Thermoplasmata archaeon]
DNGSVEISCERYAIRCIRSICPDVHGVSDLYIRVPANSLHVRGLVDLISKYVYPPRNLYVLVSDFAL